VLEARQKAASEKEVIVEPKIEQNAEEQQSGTLRGESEQVQTEGKRDSDMSIVNEAKLQDGQVVEEVAPTPNSKGEGEVPPISSAFFIIALSISSCLLLSIYAFCCSTV